MKSIAGEKLDIIVNLNRLSDVEVRDERGITKLVIPLDSAGLNVSCAGNVYVRLLAIPVRNNEFGSTHIIKLYNVERRSISSKGKDIIGNIYPHGKHDYDAKKADEVELDKRARNKEKERRQKYNGLNF